MHRIELRDPNALVTTAWLEDHLADPGLRIFDCTTKLVADEGGRRPYVAQSCLHEYELGHIPGAGYFDLQKDFSRQDSPYGMTLADPRNIAAAFSEQGIDNSSKVILYCRRGVSWSARFWWMLKWLGFDNVSILDGGHEKWEAENRKISTSPCTYPVGSLKISLRPELFVGKSEVLNAIKNPSICIISALDANVHSGEITKFSRSGKIPTSINVPQRELVDPVTGVFRIPSEIHRQFEGAREARYDGFITYCGSGIFAAVDAFWLYQLGFDNIAVYDNSMSEWGVDVSLPMERDHNPST